MQVRGVCAVCVCMCVGVACVRVHTWCVCACVCVVGVNSLLITWSTEEVQLVLLGLEKGLHHDRVESLRPGSVPGKEAGKAGGPRAPPGSREEPQSNRAWPSGGPKDMLRGGGDGGKTSLKTAEGVQPAPALV